VLVLKQAGFDEGFESVSSSQADADVKEALQDEYERLACGAGGVYAR
jgi:hypothetical protein